MIFSKCVKIYWSLVTVCSLCSLVISSWLLISVLSESDFGSEFQELYIFQLSLVWGTGIESIASVFSLGSTIFFHCCTTSYTLQKRIPFWICLNVLFLYSSVGGILFPYMKQVNYINRMHLDHQNQLNENNVPTAELEESESKIWDDIIFNDHHFLIHIYYGLLCGKAMVLVGFITTLYSYLCDLKRMNGLLHNLQFQHHQDQKNRFFVHNKLEKSQIL